MIKLRLIEAINYEKYKDKYSKDLFDWFLGIDPTSNKEYSQWIILNFSKMFKEAIQEIINIGFSYPLDMNTITQVVHEITSNSRFSDIYKDFPQRGVFSRFIKEDYSKVKRNLEDYDLLKKKHKLNELEKNIMNVKGFDDLYHIIDKHKEDLNLLKTEIENSIGSDEYNKWYEDNEWLIVVPLTEKASCKYGAGTKWCTAAREYNYFKYYSKDGPLIIIINKAKNKKWQIHLESGQWMDAEDQQINRQEFLDMLPIEIKSLLYNKTKNINFNPDLKGTIEKLIEMPRFNKEIGHHLSGDYLIILKDENDYDFDDELLEYAIYDYLSENFNEYAYDYGYHNPWEYLGETPFFADQVTEEEKLTNKNWGHDPELWSDAQREEAGSNSEGETQEADMKEMRSNINRHFFYAKNQYGTHTLDVIFNKMANILVVENKFKVEYVNVLIELLSLDEEEYGIPTRIRTILEYFQKAIMESKTFKK